ncbi:MAG: hypothetical protein ACOX9C_10930 [Kiritimatiellia bacterium]|jgi:hypothetical protein
MNTQNLEHDLELDADAAAVAAMLRAVPEQPFPDISAAVVATIRRRRRLRRRLAFVAAAAAAAVVAIMAGPSPVQVAPVEPTPQAASSEAVDADPGPDAWLLKAQEADGTWDPARWGGSREHLPAVTGFAMMALVRDGGTATDAAAAQAAQALRAMQGRDGRLGGDRSLHNHAIATGALLRLYETGRFPELFSVVDGAVNYIRTTQGAAGGWGGTSVDVWLVDALSRADALGWRDPAGHLRRGLRALERLPGESAATVAAASTLDAKRDAVAGLCDRWIAENPVSRAGGRVYAAAVAAR